MRKMTEKISGLKKNLRDSEKRYRFTSSLFLHFTRPLSHTSSSLLLLLLLTATMKVFDDDTDEHVEHEETDQQQKRDEVDQAPLAVVLDRLGHSDAKSVNSFLNLIELY